MHINSYSYIDVAQYVASCNGGVRRSDLQAAFPGADPKRLTKSMDNARSRKLIYRDADGMYKAGPRPAGNLVSRRFSDEDVDTASLIASALKSRQPIERAWLSFGIGAPSNGAHASAG